MTTVNDNIAWAEAQIAALEAELADLRAYIRVERAKGPSKLTTTASAAAAAAASAAAARSHVPGAGYYSESDARGALLVATLLSSEIGTGHGAKKRAMLTALAATDGNALRTQDIVAACVGAGFTGTTVENTSPQLSAYKADGLLTMKEGVWSITPKGRNYLAKYESGGAP